MVRALVSESSRPGKQAARPSKFGEGVLLNSLTALTRVPIDVATHTPSDASNLHVRPFVKGTRKEDLGSVGVDAPDAVLDGDTDYFAAGGDGRPHILLAPLGEEREFTTEKLRLAAARGVREAERLHLSYVSVFLPWVLPGGAAKGAQAIAEGLALAATRFDFKTTHKEGDVESGTVVYNGQYGKEEAEKGAERGMEVAHAQNIARLVGGMPASFATPYLVAEAACWIAQKAGLNVTAMDSAKLDEIGAGGIYNVGRGSKHPPAMVVIEYVPTGTPEKTIVLVGKGITFDTGGLQNKTGDPAKHMQTMRFDKCGAAAVLGTMHAMAKLRPDIRVIGILPLAENAISNESYIPGDVIQMYNGQTVQVEHTDAEGRLVLADGLAYGKETFNPTAMISIATLTGAIVTAIGTRRAGLFTTDDPLAMALEESGIESGEAISRIPTSKDYDEDYKPGIADLTNMSWVGNSGSILGHRFLQHFTGTTPFAHLDIAKAGIVANTLPAYVDAFGTGFGVRLLADAMVRLAESQHK